MFFTALVTVYFAIHLAACYFLTKASRRVFLHVKKIEPVDSAPSIAVIKPVYGADMYTEKCFRSWLTQTYDGEVQFIFALQQEDDRALEILGRLRKEFEFEVTVNSVKEGFSGKASNLFYGIQLARHEILVLSDADILASRQTLQRLVGALHSSAADIVSCIPRHTEARNIWAKIYATAWNFAIFYLWAPAILARRPTGAAGGTLALTKSSLRRLGGMESIQNFLAEDLKLGQNALKAGLLLGLGPVVDSPVGILPFEDLLDKLSRANLVAIHMFPKGLLLTSLVCAFTYAYLPLAVYAYASRSLVLILLCGAVFLIRALLLGNLTQLATGRFQFPFEFPVGDLLNTFSFFNSLLESEVFWGGMRFRVSAGGAMTRLGDEKKEEPVFTWTLEGHESLDEPNLLSIDSLSAPRALDL